jgi:hypothetical protein
MVRPLSGSTLLGRRRTAPTLRSKSASGDNNKAGSMFGLWGGESRAVLMMFQGVTVRGRKRDALSNMGALIFKGKTAVFNPILTEIRTRNFQRATLWGEPKSFPTPLTCSATGKVHPSGTGLLSILPALVSLHS